MWVYIFKTICKYVYIGIQIYACNATQCNDEYVFICVYTWIHMIFIYDLYIYIHIKTVNIYANQGINLCKYMNIYANTKMYCVFIFENNYLICVYI